MAKVSVTEYSRLGRDDRGKINAGEEPALARQSVDCTGGAANSAALNAGTKMVRVCADAAIAIDFAAAPNPQAATGTRLAANVPEYFAVDGAAVRTGTGMKIGAIIAA